VRISPDSDWAELAGNSLILALRKTDGSLWRWTFPGWEYRADPFQLPPVRLGARNDWLAATSTWEGIMSLGADGDIYYWWDRGYYRYWRDGDQPMLAPPRKPVLVENIFGNNPSSKVKVGGIVTATGTPGGIGLTVPDPRSRVPWGIEPSANRRSASGRASDQRPASGFDNRGWGLRWER
jgi:hypothetical protein